MSKYLQFSKPTRFFSPLLIMIIISFNCKGQNDFEQRYVITDWMQNTIYVLGANGEEIAKVNTNDFFIHGQMKYDHFNESNFYIFLKKKSNNRFFSLDRNGIIQPLPKNIEQITILGDTTILIKKSEYIALTNSKMEELKRLDTNTRLKFLANETILIQDNETEDWFICNGILEQIHNIGNDITQVYNYNEGWILHRKPKQDAILYHIEGKKINISKLLFERHEIAVNHDRELKIYEVSNNIFLIKVGNAYFKTFYYQADGKMIWMSDQLDIKSATSFENGYAKIERYNTTFEQYIELKKSKTFERTYNTIIINTSGKIIRETPNDETNHSIFNEEDVIVEQNINENVIYSDSNRLIISKHRSRNEKYFALIDHNGKIYWENKSN